MGIFSIFKGRGNTLYYPGCLTRFVLKQEAENYKKILVKIGIDFIMLPKQVCCGSPALNAGYETDAIRLARENLKMFKEHNIKKIITTCPACYKTFKDYEKLLPKWDIEVDFITKTILDYLKRKSIHYNARQRATYHDPCHLGRHSNIYKEPREILKLLGYNIVEMKNFGENSLCCGGGAGLKTNNPELADKIAKKRIEQAKNIHVEKIITTCPLCFAHLGENSEKMEILEFSHVVGDALGLSPEKSNPKAEKCELKEACS